MIKRWYEEYEKIKDKAIVVFGYEWESMADEQKEKILAEKTVIMSGDSGYACKRYQIIGNANNLSDHECAIIADGGNLCFGYRMEGQEPYSPQDTQPILYLRWVWYQPYFPLQKLPLYAVLHQARVFRLQSSCR